MKASPAPTRPVYPPLGVKKLVVCSYERSGPNGGVKTVHELECGCIVWGGSRKARGRPARQYITCIMCAPSHMVACACGCGELADAIARRRAWVHWRSAWWRPECVAPRLANFFSRKA